MGEILEAFTTEAGVAHAGHGPLHARRVPGAADAGGVDHEAAGLGVLEEGRVAAGLEGIRPRDDRLGVVGDEDAEDPLEEGPGRLAGLDRRLGRLVEDRVDEPVAGEDGGEDPRPEAPAPAVGVRRERGHPTGVELDLLAGAALGHRDRRARSPKPSSAIAKRRRVA